MESLFNGGDTTHMAGGGTTTQITGSTTSLSSDSCPSANNANNSSTITTNYDINILASRISNADHLIQTMNQQKQEINQLKSQLESLTESAGHTWRSFTAEKEKTAHLSAERDVHEQQINQLTSDLEKLQNELINTRGLHEQNLADLEHRLNKDDHERIVLCKNFVLQQNLLIENNLLNSNNNQKAYTMAVRVLENNGEIVPAKPNVKVRKKSLQSKPNCSSMATMTDSDLQPPSTAQNTLLPAEKEITAIDVIKKIYCDKATMQFPTTATRGTSTANLLTKTNVGTIFPEPTPLEEIFRQTICQIPELVKPIEEFNWPTSNVATQTILHPPVPKKPDTRTIGTITRLKNVRKAISYHQKMPFSPTALLSNADSSFYSIKKEEDNSLPLLTSPPSPQQLPPLPTLQPSPPIMPFYCPQFSNNIVSTTNLPINPQLTGLWQLLGQTIFSIVGSGQIFDSSPNTVDLINASLNQLRRLVERVDTPGNNAGGAANATVGGVSGGGGANNDVTTNNLTTQNPESENNENEIIMEDARIVNEANSTTAAINNQIRINKNVTEDLDYITCQKVPASTVKNPDSILMKTIETAGRSQPTTTTTTTTTTKSTDESSSLQLQCLPKDLQKQNDHRLINITSKPLPQPHSSQSTATTMVTSASAPTKSSTEEVIFKIPNNTARRISRYKSSSSSSISSQPPKKLSLINPQKRLANLPSSQLQPPKDSICSQRKKRTKYCDSMEQPPTPIKKSLPLINVNTNQINQCVNKNDENSDSSDDNDDGDDDDDDDVVDGYNDDNNGVDNVNDFDLSQIQEYFKLPELIEPILDLDDDLLELANHNNCMTVNNDEMSTIDTSTNSLEEDLQISSDEDDELMSPTLVISPPSSPKSPSPPLMSTSSPVSTQRSLLSPVPFEAPMSPSSPIPHASPMSPPSSPTPPPDQLDMNLPIKIPLEPIVATIDSPLLNVISNYSQELYSKIIITRKTSAESINPQIFFKIFNFIEQFLTNNLDNPITVVEHCGFKILKQTKRMKIIAHCLIESTENIPDLPLITAYTPPAPALTEPHQRILMLIKHLTKFLPAFDDYCEFEIERTLFSFAKSSSSTSTKDSNLLATINLTRLYISLIDTKTSSPPPTNGFRIRLFIYKCLYYYNLKATPMIFAVLMAHPKCLPEFPKDCETEQQYRNCLFEFDPLVQAVHLVLMNGNYTVSAIANDPEQSIMKKQDMLTLLRTFYNYPRFVARPKLEILVEHFIERIENNCLDNILYGMILMAKKLGWKWATTILIDKYLKPLLNKLLLTVKLTNENDMKIETILLTMSSISKTIPITEDITQLHQILMTVIHECPIERQILQEAAIAGLLQTSRFSYTLVYDRIRNWRPPFMISRKLQLQLETFVHRKIENFWN